MLLAKAGLKVTVLERLPQVGGRTSTLVEQGFRFDVGPTFFLYPRVLEEIFAAVGSNLYEEVPMVRLDPQYRIIFGAGGHINATSNLDRMQAEVARVSPGDAQSFRRFYESNRRKMDAFSPFLESPFLGWRDMAKPSLLRLLPKLKPWRSLQSELETYFKDPRLQLAFSFQSKYLGMSPFRCPSLFSILSFLEYEYGVFHPVGGCGAVSAAMARVATSLGVDIRLGQAVEEIDFSDHRAKGVYTRDEYFPCDLLVINADFARAMHRLVPDQLRSRWSNRQIAKKKFSCSTFMMYLGVRGSYEDVPHHSIYIARDYQRNLREIEDLHQLSADPSFYVCNPSVTDKTLAPPGMSSVYVLLPVTHQNANVDWATQKAGFRELALRQLAKAGLTGIEDRIVCERVVTPDEWDTGYELHMGSTFSLSHTFGQMLHLRPRNRFEDLEGVYLVGGGTHPGSGLPVIFESARISSRLILQELGLEANWIRPGMNLVPIMAEAA